MLAGQQGLDEGKGHHHHDHAEEKHRHLILEEGTQGGAPVGIVGIAAPFRPGMVEVGGGKEFLLRQVRISGGGVGLFFQVFVQRRFQLRGFHAAECHQRAPSFAVKLIRGSTRAMSRSPKSRPSTDTEA